MFTGKPGWRTFVWLAGSLLTVLPMEGFCARDLSNELGYSLRQATRGVHSAPPCTLGTSSAPLARRLNASGYPATLAVENVSAGYHTLAEAFSGWRDSPPHRANMLKNGVTKLGIAASYAPNTKYKVFWTLILASSEPR